MCEAIEREFPEISRETIIRVLAIVLDDIRSSVNEGLTASEQQKTHHAEVRGIARALTPASAVGSFRLQSADKFNKVLANWFFFDREKAAHKSGAFTGPKE
jgi:hypothetical protein